MKDAWLKYKEWWGNLATRERKGLLACSLLLGFFIVYEWIWTPYLEKIALLRKQIKSNNSLVLWMKTTDETIRELEEKTHGKAKSSSLIARLGDLKKQIDDAGLHDSLTQLKQVANDSIELHFKKVEFDKWINLLISIVKEEEVKIVQMSVVTDNTPGLVDVVVILSAAQ
jgi:type II secretory pathway component PulM